MTQDVIDDVTAVVAGLWVHDVWIQAVAGGGEGCWDVLKMSNSKCDPSIEAFRNFSEEPEIVPEIDYFV